MQNSLLSERIDEYFTIKQDTEKQIFSRLALYIYSLESGSDNDLYMLAKLLPREAYLDLINYYDGDILKLPSKEEERRCFLLAVAFYLKEIYRDSEGKGLSWKEIKDIMALPEHEKDMISSISLGRRINDIKDMLKEDLRVLITNLKNQDIDIDELVKEEKRNG